MTAHAARDGVVEKRARLRRVKLLATGLLPVMAVLFVVSAHVRARYPGFAWLESFAEAAMVGGLADWFAVVALFRHPAGLPLPHTAIIPKNKDRIGSQLGIFVEQNFLTPGIIAQKLREFELAASTLRWFARPENTEKLFGVAGDVLPRAFSAVDDDDVQRVLKRIIVQEVDRLDFANAAADVLLLLTEEERLQGVLDEALRVIAAALDRQRDEITSRFAKRSVIVLPFVNNYIVKNFVDGIIDLIKEISTEPNHEMRLAFDDYVRGYAQRLRGDTRLARQAVALKESLMSGREIDALVATLWRMLRDRVSRPSEASHAPSDVSIVDLVARIATGLLADSAVVERLDVTIGRVVEAGLERYQHQVSALIEEIVQRWDSALVTEKIELELGPDLQYIRLNGTLVGGIAGLVLHAFLVLVAPGAAL